MLLFVPSCYLKLEAPVRGKRSGYLALLKAQQPNQRTIDEEVQSHREPMEITPRRSLGVFIQMGEGVSHVHNPIDEPAAPADKRCEPRSNKREDLPEPLPQGRLVRPPEFALQPPSILWGAVVD